MPRTPDIAKRKELAAAAFALMRAQGAHAMSMSALADALGMKRPTLYWYFKDKTAVFEAVFEHILDDQAAFVSKRVRGYDHPIDLLYAHLRAVHDYYDGQEDILIFLFQLWGVSATDEPGRAVEIMARYFVPRRKAAKQLLRSGMTRGTVAADCDADTLVEMIAALIDGLIVHKVANPTADIDAAYRMIWERLLGPLRLPPAGPPL